MKYTQDRQTDRHTKDTCKPIYTAKIKIDHLSNYISYIGHNSPHCSGDIIQTSGINCSINKNVFV